MYAAVQSQRRDDKGRQDPWSGHDGADNRGGSRQRLRREEERYGRRVPPEGAEGDTREQEDKDGRGRSHGTRDLEYDGPGDGRMERARAHLVEVLGDARLGEAVADAPGLPAVGDGEAGDGCGCDGGAGAVKGRFRGTEEHERDGEGEEAADDAEGDREVVAAALGGDAANEGRAPGRGDVHYVVESYADVALVFLQMVLMGLFKYVRISGLTK